MATLPQPISALLDAVRKQPAVVLSPEDKEAYGTEAIRHLIKHEIPKPKRSLIVERMRGLKKPVERLNVISSSGLDHIEFTLRETLQKTAAMFGEDTVSTIIAEAKKVCDVRQLTLLHDPNYYGSTFSYGENMDAILKEKKLMAPCRTMSEPDRTLISFEPIHKGDAPDDRSPIFVLENMPEQDFKRSLIRFTLQNLDVEDITLTTVGGNHLEKAWQLATINNALVKMALENEKSREEMLANLPNTVQNSAFFAISEVMMPLEVSVVGHHLSHKGEKQEIVSDRVKPKPLKPERPRSIAPEPDNDDLERKPRTRGLADE